MSDQETKINNETTSAPAPVVSATPVAVAGASTATVAGASTAAVSTSKMTPGRRMRDSARAGAHGGAPGAMGAPGASRGATGNRSGSRSGGRGGNRGGENRERVKPEFDSKIIDIRRVTRVTSGGRRMNFSVAVVAGDKKGRVGVGVGKGIDTALAVEKATREAKKHLIKVPLSAQMTIPHAVEAKYSSASIMIFPARGRGVVAGSSARSVIELAGIKDVCAKIMSGSKNHLNIARVAIKALTKLSKISREELMTGKKK